MDDKKHARFTGRLVFVGFGSVGQGTLPLILRHIDMPRDRITILTGDERGRPEAKHYGIKFVVNPIKRENCRKILEPLIERSRAEQLIEVRGASGTGAATYRYALTDGARQDDG